MNHSNQFTTMSTETELIVQYLSPSTKGEGEFMTATDILRDLQEFVGTTIRLNTKLVGSALKEAGFDRFMYNDINRRKFFVQKMVV